jgi:Na+/H+ antiporter NhaD/arsenite permease-like protein
MRAILRPAFLIFVVIHAATKAGMQGVMSTQNSGFPEDRGFSIQDILWAVGIWSVILSLSPVVLFYVLMVN